MVDRLHYIRLFVVPIALVAILHSTANVTVAQNEAQESTIEKSEKEKSALPPKVKLRMRVVNSAGQPIPNASAIVQEVAQTTKYEKVGITTESDENGFIESEELPAGRTYRLVVRHQDYQTAVSRCNHALDRGEIELVDVVMSGWRTIEGRVVDDEGSPIPDARVFQSDHSSETVSTTTDQQGRFSCAEFPEQAAIVFFEHPDYWFTGQVVLPNQGKGVTQRLCPRSKPNLESWDADLVIEPSPEERVRMKQFIEQALLMADKEVSAMSQEQVEGLTDQPMDSLFLRQLGQLDPKYLRLFVGASKSSFYGVLYDIDMRSIDRKLAWLASDDNLQQKMNGLNQTSSMLHTGFAELGQAELDDTERADLERLLAHAAISLIPEARQAESVENAIYYRAMLAEILHENGEAQVASRLMNSAVSLLLDYHGAAEEPIRFQVAEHLVRMGDVDQALELTKSIKQKMFPVMLAYEVVKTSPEKAFDLVKDFEFKVNQGSRISATHGLPILCFYAAKRDTELALQFAELCENCQVRGTVSPALPQNASVEMKAVAKALPRKLLKAKLHSFIAVQIADRQPERSRQLFEQSIQTICDAEYAIENPSAGFVIAPISYLTSIVPDVARLDAGLAAETVWRAMSIRFQRDLLSPPWDVQNNWLFPLAMLKQLDRHAFELAKPALSNLQKLSYAGSSVGSGISHTPLDSNVKIEHTNNHCERASSPGAISPRTQAAVDLAASFQLQLKNEGSKKVKVGEMVTNAIHSSMWIQFSRE